MNDAESLQQIGSHKSGFELQKKGEITIIRKKKKDGNKIILFFFSTGNSKLCTFAFSLCFLRKVLKGNGKKMTISTIKLKNSKD